jgi:uncharacterized tellurite resistance protein B-like protein
MESPPTARRNSNICGVCAMGRSAHLVRKGFSHQRFPAKNPAVRRLFRKLLLFLLLMAAVYVFWPRFPSLEGFRPPIIAALECEVFEKAKARQSTGMLVALYRIFQEEFRLAPMAAAQAAWNSSQALENFLESADNADRERALPYLERTFEILRRQTDARFDPVVVARLQLHRWMLAADGNSQNQLPAAISEILAMLYGGSASEYSATAAAFAKADRLLASQKPEAARQAAASAWRRLSEQLQARTQDKS